MTRTILMAASALALLAAGPAAAMQTQTDAAEPAAAPVDDAASAQPECKPLPDGTTTDERANTHLLNAEHAARSKPETISYDPPVPALASAPDAAQAAYSTEPDAPEHDTAEQTTAQQAKR